MTSGFLGSTAFTFEGTAVVDPSTGAIVVNGNGNWKVSTETAHPVTLQNLTWTSPCAPETGSLDFAPLDVLVTENESIAVSRSVTFSAASPTDGTVSIQVGETTQQGKAELDYACQPLRRKQPARLEPVLATPTCRGHLEGLVGVLRVPGVEHLDDVVATRLHEQTDEASDSGHAESSAGHREIGGPWKATLPARERTRSCSLGTTRKPTAVRTTPAASEL